MYFEKKDQLDTLCQRDEKVENSSKLAISYATAMQIGLKKAQMNFILKTAYILLGKSCENSCSFCGMSKENLEAKRLSRVVWPEYNEEIVVARLAEAIHQNRIKRVCIQVTCNVNDQEILDVIAKFSHLNVEISLSKSVSSLEEIKRYFHAGVSRITVNVDLIDKLDFEKHKNGNYDDKINLLENAGKRYPGKIICHVIVGFSETEEAVVKFLALCQKRNVNTGLFAFFPVKGTKLIEKSQPKLSRYRRIQFAKFLMAAKGLTVSDFSFTSSGEICDVNYALDRNNLLQYGQVFQTTGCTFCTRPYYTEKPSGPLYNYPFPLSLDEVKKALLALEMRRIEKDLYAE